MSEMQSRYPGTNSFTDKQQDIFFGRQKDIEQLSKMILIEQMVLLFAKSGIGKTSLIDAGILPYLDKQQAFSFIKIRFGAYTAQAQNTPLDIAAAAFAPYYQPDTYIDKISYNERSLWYFAKIWQWQNEGTHEPNQEKTMLLVFDQFEELFTYPANVVEEFNAQLAELVYAQLPQRYFDRKELLQEIKPDLITEKEEKLLYKKPLVKILFAIRSDRMSDLNKMSDYFPRILFKNYELAPLNTLQAQKAICEPAALPAKFKSQSFTYSKEALDEILFFLTKKNKQPDNIESFQLQILCSVVEQKVENEKLTEIKPEHIGNVSDIYQNYYDNIILNLKISEKEKNLVRVMIEDGLVEEATKRRLQLAAEQIELKFGVNAAILKLLLETRLLRTFEFEAYQIYELAHDTLVDPILESAKIRKEKLEEEKAERERRLQLEELKRENERKELERKRIQAEKDRADKLLEKSRQLLRFLVPPDTELIYSYYIQLAENELQQLNFEAAAQYYLFAWLAFDLPDEMDEQVKQKGDRVKLWAQINRQALEHYRHYRYAAAESEYQKLLADFPNDEILLSRIAYCKNPLFKPENMVWVEGGDFEMGDSSDNDNSKHTVRLKDYFIGKYEITNAEYAEFLNITGQTSVKVDGKDEPLITPYWLGLEKEGKIWKPAREKYTMHPVVMVSWFGALGFAKFWNMRLPTEAEWEFAARSRGKNHKYSWGNEEPINLAKGLFSEKQDAKQFGNIADVSFGKVFKDNAFERNYDDGYAYTSPVGSFNPNELGLFDMSGNVWEWCHDWYSADYYQNSPKENPCGPESGASRVIRGGSWSFVAVNCRAVYRGSTTPSNRDFYLGFRLCRTK